MVAAFCSALFYLSRASRCTEEKQNFNCWFCNKGISVTDTKVTAQKNWIILLLWQVANCEQSLLLAVQRNPLISELLPCRAWGSVSLNFQLPSNPRDTWKTRSGSQGHWTRPHDFTRVANSPRRYKQTKVNTQDRDKTLLITHWYIQNTSHKKQP